MKTHPESIWIDSGALADSRENGFGLGDVMSKESDTREDDREFVPATAYVELKNSTSNEINTLNVRLEKREMQLTDAISTATKVLDELATANAQLQTQTKNMRELREFMETIANDELDEHGESLIYKAQDLIGRITR